MATIDIFNLSPRDFNLQMQEEAMYRTPAELDELRREYRNRNSMAGKLMGLLAPEEGKRRSTFLPVDAPQGMSIFDALRSGQATPAVPQGLVDLITGGTRGVESAREYAQGVPPRADALNDALTMAGLAMTGGGAVGVPRGAVGANAADLRRQANIERFGYDPNEAPEVSGFDAYLRRVNPSDKRIPEENRPNLMMGDMYGMLPRDAEYVSNIGSADIYRTPDGSYYATAYNPDLGEMDVVGYAIKGDKETDLQVVSEMQGKGIGGELQYLFRKENPDAPTGGLTEAGEASLLKTYNKLRDDGVVAANASKSAGLLTTAASEAQDMAKRILELRAEGRASEVTDEMMAQADPQYMFANTPLPMDEASRMARAEAAGFEGQTYYHGAKDTPELPYFDRIDEYNTEGHAGTIYGTSSPAVANTYVRRSSAGIDEGAIYPLMARRDPNDPTINVGGVYSRIPMSIRDEKGQRLIDVLPEAAEMDHLNAERVTSTDAIASAMRDADFSMLRMENVVDRGPYYPDATPLGFEARSYKDIERQNEFNKWNREMLAEANEPATNIMVQDPTKLRSRFARFDPEFAHLSNLSAANASPIGGLLAQSGVSDKQAERIEEYLRRRGLLD
jgi:hypothetical protein